MPPDGPQPEDEHRRRVRCRGLHLRRHADRHGCRRGRHRGHALGRGDPPAQIEKSGVVSREEALLALDGQLIISALPSEVISLSSSLGRIIALDILSPSDQPAFDRSTMDGYAVRSSDTFGAAESRPALLAVVGDILMGTMPGRAIGKGECMKIATGGALPEGADAVVMFEQTQRVDDRTIEVVKAVAPEENVSKTGEDMKKGSAVFDRGHVIRPQDM